MRSCRGCAAASLEVAETFVGEAAEIPAVADPASTDPEPGFLWPWVEHAGLRVGCPCSGAGETGGGGMGVSGLGETVVLVVGRRRVTWRQRACWMFVVVVLGVLGVSSPAAADSECPAASPSDFGPCGPTFTLPERGDAGGWTSPDQFQTIQLGDVLGDGQDQLIGRSADGIEIWEFDTSLGQWRPAVDSGGKPMILTGFADPPPLTQANPTYTATDWTDTGHYPTIQVADVLGNGRDQIIARANSGVIVFSYVPGAGGAPGAWSQTFSGPFSNADGFIGLDSGTIHTADLTGDGKADVFAATPSGAVQAYEWDGSGFQQLPAIPGTFAEGSTQAITLQASPSIAGRQELWWVAARGWRACG